MPPVVPSDVAIAKLTSLSVLPLALRMGSSSPLFSPAAAPKIPQLVSVVADPLEHEVADLLGEHGSEVVDLA